MEKAKNPVRVEDKLAANKFKPDEEHSHIQVDKLCSDSAAVEDVIKVCPAGLYKYDPNGKLVFDYLGCLECGTCRILSLGKVVKDWNYPIGTLGVEYRQG